MIDFSKFDMSKNKKLRVSLDLSKLDFSKLKNVGPDLNEAARLMRAGRLQDSLAALLGRQAPAPRSPQAPENDNDHSDHLDDISTPVQAPQKPDARFETRAFTGPDGYVRHYKIYIPANLPKSGAAMIVMLHGCKQSPDDFARGTKMNALAEEYGFLVVYPAQPRSANMSKCWNWFETAHQKRDAGEPGSIAGLTREAAGAFAVDPKRIYVAGLSAGGAAAAVLAAQYPDLYAAVGVHSGLACGAASDLASGLMAMQGASLPLPEAPANGTPTIVFHGDQDKVVHPVNGDKIVAQTKSAQPLQTRIDRGVSAGGVSYTRVTQMDAGGKPFVEQWVAHGADHAWFGGDPAGSYTNPRGPDASREMVRFFLQHKNQRL